jgi:putative colanic acid biosysnthesis UDP-glucose lipid carrier transferase
MKIGHKSLFKTMQVISDLIVLNGCFVLSFFTKFQFSTNLPVTQYYFYLILSANVLWFIIALAIKLYDIPRFSILAKIVRKTLFTYLTHLSLILVFILSFKTFYYSMQVVIMGYLFFFLTVFFTKAVNVLILKQLRKKGFNYKNVIIVGEGLMCNQLANYFNSDLSAGYNFLGFFHNRPEQCMPRNKVLGNIDSVLEFITKHKVDELYCAFPHQKVSMIRQMRLLADNNLVRFKVVPDFNGLLNTRIKLDFYYDTPIISFRNEPLSLPGNQFLKRAFDFTFSLIVMILLSPLFLAIALIVKLSSPGPVFFRQGRSGKDNSKFVCYKFRTMYLNEESDVLQASNNDPRITAIGKFLRKSNLDELPQFINVLLGHMSVVGPRPHMLSQTSEYSKMINKFMVRHLVMPGITGWAQIHGLRGPLDKKLMYERVSLDVWYIENWSFLLDVNIIFRTVLNMIKGEKNAF